MIKRIIRGAKGDPGAGAVLILSVLLGGLVIIGLARSSTWQDALIGVAIVFIMAVLPWLIVAYENGDN